MADKGSSRFSRQFEPDCNVNQIENQIAHQIEVPARLAFEGSHIACCTRLPDWTLYQIDHFGLRARLPDWSIRQIMGAFLPKGRAMIFV